MDSLDVSGPAEAWVRPLSGSVSVLPCTVLSSGIRRGLANADRAGLGTVCTWWKEGWEIMKKKEDEN